MTPLSEIAERINKISGFHFVNSEIEELKIELRKALEDFQKRCAEECDKVIMQPRYSFDQEEIAKSLKQAILNLEIE